MRKTHEACNGKKIDTKKVTIVYAIFVTKKGAGYRVEYDNGKRVKVFKKYGGSTIGNTSIVRKCRFELMKAVGEVNNQKLHLTEFGDDVKLMTDGKEMNPDLQFSKKDIECILNEIKDIYKAIIKRNELDDQLHKSKVADMQKAYGEINEAVKQLDMEKNTLFSIIRETRDKRHQRFVEAEHRLVDMVRSCQNIKREVENMVARTESKKEAVKEMTELLPYQQSLNAAILYLQNFLFDFGQDGELVVDPRGRNLQMLKEADKAIAGVIREMKHMRLEEQSYRPHSAKSVVEMALRLMSEEKLDVKKIKNLAKGALNTLVYFMGSNDDPSVKKKSTETLTGLKGIFERLSRPVGNYSHDENFGQSIKDAIEKEFPGAEVTVIDLSREGGKGHSQQDQNKIEDAVEDLKGLLKMCEFRDDYSEDQFVTKIASCMIRTGVLRDTLKRRGVQANTDVAERCHGYMIRVNQLWKENKKEVLAPMIAELTNAIRQVEKLFWPKREPQAAEPAREQVKTFPEDPRRKGPAGAVDRVEEALDQTIESLKKAETVLINNVGTPGAGKAANVWLNEAADSLETLRKRTAVIPEGEKLVMYLTAIATTCEQLYGAMGRAKLFEICKFPEIKSFIGKAMDTLKELKDHPADDHEDIPRYELGGEG